MPEFFVVLVQVDTVLNKLPGFEGDGFGEDEGVRSILYFFRNVHHASLIPTITLAMQ